MISFILKDGAKLPSRGSEQAAGLDICCTEDFILLPYERKLISTGVTLASCPIGMYLRVAPRSKLAHKHGIDVLAGVVDSDYRGEIGVILLNTSDASVELFKGTAIAQLIPETISTYDVVEAIKVVHTERGEAGVNSTEERLKGKEEDLCAFCENNFATCNSNPTFASTTDDTVVKCDIHKPPF